MADAAVGSGPRYAPVDPTLPPPWRALVDGNTGYIYYWNTETNVTQYEKPAPPPAPPLPPGPPPGSAGPNQPRVAPSGTSDVQRGRSAEGRSSANGSMPSSPAVTSHASGGPAHGLSGGNLHAGGGGSSFTNSGGNVHGKPASNVPYGNSSSNAPGHPSGHMHGGGHPGGHMPVSGGSSVPNSSSSAHGKSGGNAPGSMYGSSHSNAPVHLGGHMLGSGPRSGPGMSGGGVHMNVSDNSYGSSSRHAYGSSGGTARGGSAPRNIHGGAGGNVPVQPKLAALPVPQRQQGVGGMHMSVQPRQLGHTASLSPGSSAAPVTGSAAGYKRSSGDYLNHEPEPHKIPRMQGYMEPLALDADTYRRQHEITVVGDNVPLPFMTFDAANFPSEISKELQVAGFSAPTPIQAQSWPVALQNRDIVAIAKTGSGKTLGYLLPAFLHLSRIRANSRLGPVVLVLAPTRELATQIQDEAVKFGRSSRISCTCVYGGAPKGQQLRELDRGADIVIATPGRLNDFLEMRRVSLRQVSYLVLDEADRMLDMGFEPQIRKIVKEVPPRRQTLMYTATWPKEVRKIAADLLVNAVQVNIGNSDELTANKSITQLVEMVHPYEKQRRLEQILRSQEPGSKIIIFCSTKKMCDQLAHTLARGFGAAAIHGDKSQSERDYVLAQFKSGRSPILVATDVAARGLDIKDIRVVINFDFPTGVEDYVHRIGRTGRAGATGVAFTFFSEQDSKYAKELIGVLEVANQKVPVELRNFASKSTHLRGRGGRWDAGGIGARNSGYNSFGGGRGDARADSFGGRGSWGVQGGRFNLRERGFGERDKFYEGTGGRLSDDRNRGRDSVRKFGARERGQSPSRSCSRSPGWSRSPSRSCSRSRSYDRYSDDHYRRSPRRGRDLYKSRSPYRSVSPRSPSQGLVPRRHGKAAIISSEPHLGIDRSVAAKEPQPTDQATAPTVHYRQSPQGGWSSYRSRSPYRSVSPRSPYLSHSPYRHGKATVASSEPHPSGQSAEVVADKGISPRSPYPSHSPYRHSKAAIASKESVPPVEPGIDGEVSLPGKGPTDHVTKPTDQSGTYRSRSLYGSVSPRSPYQSRSPYRHSKVAIASNDVHSSDRPVLPHVSEDISGAVKEVPPSDQVAAPSVGNDFDIDCYPHEPPNVLDSSTQIEDRNQPVQPERRIVEFDNDACADNNPEV